MDKTDIAHALNQYVEKLNIVLKTLRKHPVHYCLWNNVFIHNFNAKCLWCYTIFMVTPFTVTPQKT
jgi:CRISPR/Cas system CMR-associated protein Cmr1 (group 7 of RAMP superfamily)